MWERNTVWRELIGLERRGNASGLGGRGGLTGDIMPIVGGGVGGEEDEGAQGGKGGGRRKRRGWWWDGRVIAGAVGVALFLFVLANDWFGRREEQNCAALLVLVTIFWALEVSFWFRLGMGRR